MSVLCLNVCRLCVPNITSLGICLKKLHLVKVGSSVLDTASKVRVILAFSLKDEKLTKANLHEN